jgi:predicted ribosomally synthesized peptide with nif11-like leader
MSKDNVLEFFNKAAESSELKGKLQNVTSQEELVELGNEAGYEFESEHVDEALTTLKEQPGFFKVLAEAVLEIFSPAKDNYPATGAQPFSGDIKRS